MIMQPRQYSISSMCSNLFFKYFLSASTLFVCLGSAKLPKNEGIVRHLANIAFPEKCRCRCHLAKLILIYDWLAELYTPKISKEFLSKSFWYRIASWLQNRQHLQKFRFVRRSSTSVVKDSGALTEKSGASDYIILFF